MVSGLFIISLLPYASISFQEINFNQTAGLFRSYSTKISIQFLIFSYSISPLSYSGCNSSYSLSVFMASSSDLSRLLIFLSMFPRSTLIDKFLNLYSSFIIFYHSFMSHLTSSLISPRDMLVTISNLCKTVLTKKHNIIHILSYIDYTKQKNV